MSKEALKRIKEAKKTGTNTLILSNCDLTEIPEELNQLDKLTILEIAGNQISDTTPLHSLTNLTELYLRNNLLTDISPLESLTNLTTLDLSSNTITDISPLQPLTKLLDLYLYNNKIVDISPLRFLTSLRSISLFNNQVSDIRPILPIIKKGVSISTSGNPLTTPPQEVVAQGNEAIVRYFEETKKQGEENLYEAKIVIVGAGESGKTTLIRKLLNPGHPVPNPDDKRTEGIRITSLPFNTMMNGVNKDLIAHVWDFGGQELYHTTHQLFLTPDTLYILLNDNRKNDTDFYYWLNIVTLRAGDKCPILMVFNAKQGSPRQILPGEDLFNEFCNLVRDPIDINFADKDTNVFEKLRTNIQDQFAKLEILQKPFPAYWIEVRDALNKLPEEYIEFKDLVAICKNHKVNDLAQIRILAQTLHNLGSLLYFPAVFGLEDLIILQSQWCIDAIYSALDTQEVKDNGGRFSDDMLAMKWSSDRFSGKRLQLLKLMQHFDLCYSVEGTNDYIAPQLLPLEEKRYKDFPQQGVIVYRFDYTFMPAGIITRLIARLSNFIKSPYVWRSGVTLEWEEGTMAEVIENGFTRQIIIRVAGPQNRRRLTEICKTLHSIHKNFKGLKCAELVACNCEDCSKGADVTVFDLKELQDDADHDDEVTCRNGKRKKIPARQILNGITYEDKPRIFISYSHKNETFKDEFRTMIKPLEKEGKWKVWDDRWLLPGDNWNAEILRHLSEANVIVLMLTADFFNSDYIYDIEMSKAIQRHQSGDALVVGIVVSDCLWEETPLQKIQIIPKDGTPVERQPNRNEIWKTVATKIKETIQVRNKQRKRKGGWGNPGEVAEREEP